MQITPKSPELIEAQVKEFALQGVAHDVGSVILENIDTVTDGPGEDFAHTKAEPRFTRVGTSDEAEPYNQWNDDPNFEAQARARKVRVTRDVTETHIPYSDYVDFLKKGGHELREGLRFVESATRAYETYRPYVEAISQQVKESGDPKLEALGEDSPYLGAGYHGKAYKFIGPDGQQLVAKINHDSKNRRMSQEEGMAFAIGETIEGVQHMVAASPEGNVNITELLPGRLSWELTLADRQAIPDEHIAKALRTLAEMHGKGLSFDPKADNTMYDPETRFRFLDYQRAAGKSRQNIPENFMYFSHRIANTLSPLEAGKDPERATQEEELSARYARIVRHEFPELADETERQISEYQAQIDKHEADWQAYLSGQPAA